MPGKRKPSSAASTPAKRRKSATMDGADDDLDASSFADSHLPSSPVTPIAHPLRPRKAPVPVIDNDDDNDNDSNDDDEAVTPSKKKKKPKKKVTKHIGFDKLLAGGASCLNCVRRDIEKWDPAVDKVLSVDCSFPVDSSRCSPCGDKSKGESCIPV